MRIALFGATGRVGKHVVEQALAQGHDLTLLVRDAAKAPQHARVRVVTGSADDPASVRSAIEGADAVVSALGPTKDGPPDLMTRWTRHALAAMHASGVRRIVVLSGAGAGAPPPKLTLIDHMFRWMLRTFVKAPYADKEEQLRLLAASGLDWVAVRPPAMFEGPRTGTYRMGNVIIGRRFRVNTGDAADALLRHIGSDAPSGEAPLLAAA